MRSALRPTVCLLLVVLLTTWGTCPCVYAQMLGGAAEDAAPAPKACCCCKQRASAERDAPRKGVAAKRAPKPAEDDCPCCSHGGWMRDLPPQAQALDLAAPAVVLGALPVPVRVAPALELVPIRRPEIADPPRTSAHRPHASPVGIVRLLD